VTPVEPTWLGLGPAAATTAASLRELAGFVAGLLLALLSAPFFWI
jgi:hypothetical protein